MTTFRYQARNRSGERFQGTVEAVNRQAAAQQIRQRGLWVAGLQVLHVSAAAESDRKLGRVVQRLQLRLAGARGSALLARQLAVLLSAGLPVHEALRSLQVTDQSDWYQMLIHELLESVLQGKSLAAAMKMHPLVFSATVISLVQAGEESGSLDRVLGRLADFLERSYAAREKMKSVLLYPAILGVTTLAAFLFLLVFILPTLAAMLLNLHTELPWLTRSLLSLSALLQSHGEVVVLLFMAMAGLVVGLYHRPAIRLQVDRLALRLPVYGRLRRDTAWMLVLGTLSLLIANGIPLQRALTMVAAVTDNRCLQVQLQQIAQAVERGRALADSLRCCAIFPPMLREMIQAGEQAGELELMLQKAAEFCAMTAANESERLQAMAEPTAILLVGGLVFGFVLSIILPLLGVMDYMV